MLTLVLVLLAALLAAPAANAAGTSTITGVAFKDLDRDGVKDAGEAAMADQRVYLMGANGAFITQAMTGADGGYAFSDLADGTYRVQYESGAWSALKADWVPTTTGSVWPRHTVQLAGSATADFGWRPLTTSTTLSAPVATYVGANGLRVETFNDAMTPRELYDALVAGFVGVEAPNVTVRFAYNTTNMTSATAGDSNGRYTSYRAISYVSYASWLDGGDQTLVHEYGHAWSLYHAYLTQQDPTMQAYLKARGLAGDARVGSGYGWSVSEMIAEDYRQLFGSANAKARPQMNTEIPPAADVPGLRDFLLNTWTTAPAASQPASAPAPAPALAITALSVNPSPVKTTGTVSFTLSAPAAATVKILDAKGALVRTLATSVAYAAGTSSLTWNRLSDSGRKVGRGTYTAFVEAVASSGERTTRSTAFSVA